MAGWQSNSRGPRSRGFPEAVRLAILLRDRHQCQLAYRGCTGAATDADHIIPVCEGGDDEMSNGQAVCPACHKIKTQAEATRARRRRTRRPTPRHPGLRAG
ncbi:MAG: HNH endonuclease [Microbacterium sp.]|uniref:HNH endonuclease n=1 Tax=Microbacterium sp. TaxID=51671 RepID=UPI000DB3220B|nr:HNH endonuclease signature motif containing protein [Microbacterium sp.]PZU37047.1 MAG: HNH endonuclease [Microbacterium sp.]